MRLSARKPCLSSLRSLPFSRLRSRHWPTVSYPPKWAGAVVLASGVMGGAWAVRSAASARPSPVRTAPSASTVLAASAAPAATPVGPRPPEVESESANEPAEVGSASPPPQSSAGAPRAANSRAARASAGKPDVTEELRLLEIARRKLRGGDPTGALSALEQYRRSAPRGALRVEADALEIEAIVATGRRADAARRGRAFLDRHGDGPLSERVRRLIAE